MSFVLSHTRTFIKRKATRIARLSIKRCISIQAIRINRNRRLRNNTSKYLKLIRIATRSFAVDYNNPSRQLIEENAKLNYKLYYQYGLPTIEDINEFNDFNDKIWYGQQGKEIVFQFKNGGQKVKDHDIIIMRDYQNNKIIAFNSIKRVSSTFDKVLNTTKYGSGSFNFTLRQITAVSKEFQGKGYGSIVRHYSREIDDLHVNNQGVSITDVQTKNTASINLQLKAGFEEIGTMNFYQYYRWNLALPQETFKKWDIYKMDTMNATNHSEWDNINNLHQNMMKKYGIIDLSIQSEVYAEDPKMPVYVIKAKGSDDVLAAIQVSQMAVKIRAPSSMVKYGMVMASKVIKGLMEPEKEFTSIQIQPLYVDYDNDKYDVKDCVKSLVSFILNDYNINMVQHGVYDSNPHVEFIEKYGKDICGQIGFGLKERSISKIFMKFSGLDEEIKNLIKNNPIMVKLPNMFQI